MKRRDFLKSSGLLASSMVVLNQGRTLNAAPLHRQSESVDSSIAVSIESHVMGFRGEQSRINGTIEKL